MTLQVKQKRVIIVWEYEQSFPTGNTKSYKVNKISKSNKNILKNENFYLKQMYLHPIFFFLSHKIEMDFLNVIKEK